MRCTESYSVEFSAKSEYAVETECAESKFTKLALETENAKGIENTPKPEHDDGSGQSGGRATTYGAADATGEHDGDGIEDDNTGKIHVWKWYECEEEAQGTLGAGDAFRES